jgi:hypothetical protein
MSATESDLTLLTADRQLVVSGKYFGIKVVSFANQVK